MSNFSSLFDTISREEIQNSILSKTSYDVENALGRSGNRTLEDFKSLISPAAEKYMEEMARLSHESTCRRFGKTIQLYTPVYLSNECKNICTYCAFSYDNKISRITLSENQVLAEVKFLKNLGFDHILIVTGESNTKVGMDYFMRILKLIRPYFSHISFEVQPLDMKEYETLISLGLNTVLIYQETYNKDNYNVFHPKGKKANFYYRLETPDRLGAAGIYKIGLGVLLGLDDWRLDSYFCASHLHYLEKKYWKTKYSISFPRLRPIEIASGMQGGDPQIKIKSFESAMSDRHLFQLICAYRIFKEEVELSLSTRESENFRNNMIKFGITSMSAGSKTNPGGYSFNDKSLEQFEISDNRHVDQIIEMVKSKGYEPMRKDWDRAYLG